MKQLFRRSLTHLKREELIGAIKLPSYVSPSRVIERIVNYIEQQLQQLCVYTTRVAEVYRGTKLRDKSDPTFTT